LPRIDARTIKIPEGTENEATQVNNLSPSPDSFEKHSILSPVRHIKIQEELNLPDIDFQQRRPINMIMSPKVNKIDPNSWRNKMTNSKVT
jgi:hypothetical protein